MRLIGPGLLAALLLTAAPAQAFELVLPVDCTLGEDCVIQQYADRDPGPGAVDFTCGTLAYDGHQGTDFRLRTREAMREGVDVLAAAPGVVSGTRDGMPDIAIDEPGAPALAGRDCGNGVAILHAGGWTTQYCHMREGSIAVAKGDSVTAGQRLGQIGLSGRTQFPHLHITVRDPNKNVVDPFDALAMAAACGTGQGDTLWAVPIAYQPGGLISAGMTGHVPDLAEIKDHAPTEESLGTDAEQLIAWVYFFGVRTGDLIRQELRAPNGQVIARNQLEMTRSRATQMRYTGRKRPRLGWPAGVYTARGTLTRDGTLIDEVETRLEIR